MLFPLRYVRSATGLVFLGSGVVLFLWGIRAAKRALAGNPETGIREWFATVQPIVDLVLGACGIFAGVVVLPIAKISIGRSQWLDAWLSAWFDRPPLRTLVHAFPIIQIVGGLYFFLVPGIWAGKRALTRGTGSESKPTAPLGESIGWGVLGVALLALGVLSLPESPARLDPLDMIALPPLALIGILVMLFVSGRNEKGGRSLSSRRQLPL